MAEAEFIPVIVKWTPVMVSFLGAGSALILYHGFGGSILNLKLTFRPVYIFLNNKWHFDSIYNHFIVKPLVFFGHNVSYKIIDRGLIEYVGPTGLVSLVKNLSLKLSSLQAGYVYNYALTMFLGCTMFLMLINNMSNVTELLLIIVGYIVLIV
jgi:NADH-ubiquinone oxidoreductase chain 5